MFVKRPDASLLSLSFGHGPQTLLALGGWIGSGEVWHDLFGELPHWRCVSMDHRGSGASTHSTSPITLEAMVDDVLAVMDAQGIDRCVLAAESGGAGVALEVALKAPERISGLVLVGASWRRISSTHFDDFVEWLRKDFDGAIRAFATSCVPEANGADQRRWGYQVLRRSTLQSAIELLLCRCALTVEDRLSTMRVPTLLVHGTLDGVSPPDDSRLLAKRLLDAELHILPGLGHVPILTAPAAVARLIEQRFTSVQVRAAA
jgi:pimeloyl-ACP methyl ester carboxylesterase